MIEEVIQYPMETTKPNLVSPLEQVLKSFSSDSSLTVKYGTSGKSLVERLFRRASILIMEHNGIVGFDNKPVEYEDTIFVYYAAEVVEDRKLSYLSGADYIQLSDSDEYAVIARLKVPAGESASFYVAATSESFVTMAIMKFT